MMPECGVLQNPYVPNLIDNVVVAGDGTFGRGLDHEGGIFINEIRALMIKVSESSLVYWTLLCFLTEQAVQIQATVMT